jgi:hypothetical protein
MGVVSGNNLEAVSHNVELSKTMEDHTSNGSCSSGALTEFAEIKQLIKQSAGQKS